VKKLETDLKEMRLRVQLEKERLKLNEVLGMDPANEGLAPGHHRSDKTVPQPAMQQEGFAGVPPQLTGQESLSFAGLNFVVTPRDRPTMKQGETSQHPELDEGGEMYTDDSDSILGITPRGKETELFAKPGAGNVTRVALTTEQTDDELYGSSRHTGGGPGAKQTPTTGGGPGAKQVSPRTRGTSLEQESGVPLPAGPNLQTNGPPQRGVQSIFRGTQGGVGVLSADHDVETTKGSGELERPGSTRSVQSSGFEDSDVDGPGGLARRESAL